MHKVAITGASGFIGKHLTSHLALAGYEIHAIVRRAGVLFGPGIQAHLCPLADRVALGTFLRDLAPEYIIHLAARTQPGRDFAELEPQYENTIRPCLNLALEAPASTRLTLFAGSCEEYGNRPAPFNEESEVSAFSPYGWAKISAYHGASAIARQRGLRWAWMRPFLTFGPGLHSPRLIPTLIKGCLADREIALSPGWQTRDFVYVADLCRMIQTLIENDDRANGKTINLCTGIPRSGRAVGETIRSIIGTGELQWGAIPYRVQEAMKFFGSTARFDELFGKAKLMDFEEALALTIEDYRRSESTWAA